MVSVVRGFVSSLQFPRWRITPCLVSTMGLELTWRPFPVEESKFSVYTVQKLFKIISILKCFNLYRNTVPCPSWSVFLSFLYYILRRTRRKFNGKSTAVGTVPTDFHKLKPAKYSLHHVNWMPLKKYGTTDWTEKRR
jgi:hypothetical protein